jgi:nucleotide-binding universal stress UspA family protein
LFSPPSLHAYIRFTKRATPRIVLEASRRRQFLLWGASGESTGNSWKVSRRIQAFGRSYLGMFLERWIVVGTDFSDGARSALGCAMRLARGLEARVALVHAYEETPCAHTEDDPTPKVLIQLAREIVLSRASGPRVHVEPLVRRGRPWEKILNVATEYGAELTVVGSTGQSGEARGLALGSVVSRVLALSTRSVVVARAHLASPVA